MPGPASESLAARLAETAGVFLKLGTISFGGPAAHMANMEHEIVARRAWVTRQEFLDLLGATNLIPGPNAVEMAAHLGYRRAGLAGSLVGGVAFTLPAVLITLGLVWFYVRFGSLGPIQALLSGIKPAVLAVIFGALWRLSRAAVRRWQLVLVALGGAAAVLSGADEVITLLTAALIGFLLLSLTQRTPPRQGAAAAGTAGGLLILGWPARVQAALVGTAAAGASGAAANATLWKLGLFFLKVGAVMYGSGLVLVAYLEGGLVGQYPGFGQAELMDAVAIGQFTPGPLLTAATFAGYVIAGVPGAVVATGAFILPCFVFVTLTNPWIPRLRQSPVASRLLDAVNAAALGLMAAVTFTLARTALVDGGTWAIALTAVVLAVRWRVQPAWLVLGGAVAGWLLHAVG